ncbi:vacuolar ATP synthase subunit H [Cunninghamella echinulata]|nr:vacuolar ATP synthase subunit H [Cunninghamella echinulata]
MLVADVISLVQHLSARKWADQELVEDLHFIQEELENTRENLTTFELYAAEIETGKLEWSPPHKSDSFWKENVERFNEHDHQLLKQLTRLLHSTQDPTVLAIALHDLGQYVKYVKDGKRHLEAVGAKQKIMELLTYNSEQVRFEALRATQKYFAMVS